MTPEQIIELRRLATENIAEFRKKFTSKNENVGFVFLVTLLEKAHIMGLQVALDSEASAWAEVNRLEDLIIGMLRYAPDTDLVLARASAKAASLTDQPELYAKAVTLATGGMA